MLVTSLNFVTFFIDHILDQIYYVLRDVYLKDQGPPIIEGPFCLQINVVKGRDNVQTLGGVRLSVVVV